MSNGILILIAKQMGNRPHYYLLYFGTDPNHEGRGNGAFLMKEQLKV